MSSSSYSLSEGSMSERDSVPEEEYELEEAGPEDDSIHDVSFTPRDVEIVASTGYERRRDTHDVSLVHTSKSAQRQRQRRAPLAKKRTSVPSTPSRPKSKRLVRARSARPAVSGHSLPYEMARDTIAAAGACLAAIRKSYGLWKWGIAIYLIWLALSYLAMSMYSFASNALAPFCAIPVIGPKLPLCSFSFEEPKPPLDFSSIENSQTELVTLAHRADFGFKLGKEMSEYSFAVRHLRTRISASDLPHKEILAKELVTLSEHTMQVSRIMASYSAKMEKTVDIMVSTDEYVMKRLERIAEREQNPSSSPLLWRAVSALSPLAAFQLSDADRTEAELKSLVFSVSSEFSERVGQLQGKSRDLGRALEGIQETLDRMQVLAIREVADLPHVPVLEALWTRLARPDDYKLSQRHPEVLKDVTNMYGFASNVVEETIGSLNNLEAELTEFEEQFSTPGLVMQDYPLEVIISVLDKSVRRLQSKGIDGNINDDRIGSKPYQD